MMRGVFISLVALGMLGGVGATADGAPDPYTIFAQARAFWMQQRYPEFVSYRVAVRVREGGKERVERYQAALDARTGAVRVDPVSDYELAHPVKPTGVSLGILFWRVGKPLPPVDFMGVPQLSPTYSFGMAPFVPAPTPTPFNSAALVNEIRRAYHDPNPRTSLLPSPTPPGLREIAVTTAFRRDYTIALVGVEDVDGHACYHLTLRPTHDPRRLRIRDAWIDEKTYATWKLVNALNFTDGPGTGVPWTIRFADLDGARYIAEEAANAPVRAGGEIYERTAIRFEDVHAVARMPLRAPFGQSGTYLEEP